MQQTDLFEFDQQFLGQSNQCTKTVLQEYHLASEDIKKEISNCKVEQVKLRNELEAIRNENKYANEAAQKSFSQVQNEICPVHSETENVMIANLEKRLVIMQMETESVFQLWQMSLKTIDILEEELKSCQRGSMDDKLYEHQVNTIKESYSNAIKELESKLIQSKKHFLMHQNLFESSKTKTEELTKEKNDLLQKIKNIEHEIKEKEEKYTKIIKDTEDKLNNCENEVENLNKTKLELQKQLSDAQKLFAGVVEKDNESMLKISEALELVESAIREKEEAFRRESRTLEEASILKLKLNNINREYDEKLENEIKKIKTLHDSNLKEYVSEIEELKLEIQQKATVTDRIQRERSLIQEELDKVLYNSNNFCQKYETKILELEQKLSETEKKLKMSEESWRLKYNEKCQILRQYDQILNEKSYESKELLRKSFTREPTDVENLVKEVNERTKEAVQKYSNIERSLSKSFHDKEKIDVEIHSLQMALDRETERRHHERKLMELKIRDLQEELRFATSNINDTKSVEQMNLPVNHSKISYNNDVTGNINLIHTEAELKQLQQINESKIKELTSHVEIHQTLNKKWQEETKFLTNKFKKHTKEMRHKVNTLQQENEKLTRELFFCRQKLAQYNTQIIKQYKQEDEVR